MTTISSTPEKTVSTLTGNECIPLSDKTHIKTQLLLNLANQIGNIQNLTLYKKIYDLSTDDNIDNTLNENNIQFQSSYKENEKLYISGTVTIPVPHKGKYYITLENCAEKNSGTTLSAGTNVYNISSIIITVLSNVSSIVLQISDYISVECITIAETPMVIEEVTEKVIIKEIETKESTVDDENECLILNL